MINANFFFNFFHNTHTGAVLKSSKTEKENGESNLGWIKVFIFQPRPYQKNHCVPGQTPGTSLCQCPVHVRSRLFCPASPNSISGWETLVGWQLHCSTQKPREPFIHWPKSHFTNNRRWGFATEFEGFLLNISAYGLFFYKIQPAI